ncbi:glycosyltransferase involved in cell wall biosynthesis [Mangrovibacterium marinum]|uniref:Glycosyltransferase involved in cell wall biosynthesis n=1 Tax=Mangrovibacterium marinum TaxID=1639118 RepID=A0A2T5BTZ5_9BACT|nr:glycosyltransferase family 1 protein [Mangrovibacterium marinum]PTN02881.1 glycosyltransferase involved in cell wall biosynthesis [Mangrovibacterium marinum]
MNITYFQRSPKVGISIHKVFTPIINAIAKEEEVISYDVPSPRSTPLGILKNLWFVYKHRSKTGINHITGDIHYCILALVGCKTVLTVHDDSAISRPRKDTLSIHIYLKFKELLWFKLPIKYATKIICISQHTKNSLKKWDNTDKMQVIYDQIDTEFKYSPKDFNAQKPTILHVGTEPHKNLETVIQSLTGLNCILRILKPMSDKQKRLAESNNINYHNPVDISNEELIQEYRNADIISFPSSFEGFGLPIIEGQATGRVVITSNMAPMNEIAGLGAFLVKNPKDPEEVRKAIVDLIKDQSLRDNLIENGLKNSSKFSLDTAVKNYKSIYQKIAISK